MSKGWSRLLPILKVPIRGSLSAAISTIGQLMAFQRRTKAFTALNQMLNDNSQTPTERSKKLEWKNLVLT